VSVYTLLRNRERLDATAIWSKFARVPAKYIPAFRDAGVSVRCSFPLTIRDLLEGISASIRYGWINWSSFDVKKTEKFQQVDNGDMNWIIENQFLAFAGPSDDRKDEDGYEVLAPSDYIGHFKSRNISDVVRLNIPNYCPSGFTNHGINHHDLFFEDGSCPPWSIVHAFLAKAQTAKGAVAVHCKAGLGRSVTLIGTYVMREYGVPAKIFIAWARIARPGSVIGPQQHFLVEWEQMLTKKFRPPRKLRALGSDSSIGKSGDRGQASRLLQRKRSRGASPRGTELGIANST